MRGIPLLSAWCIGAYLGADLVATKSLPGGRAASGARRGAGRRGRVAIGLLLGALGCADGGSGAADLGFAGQCNDPQPTCQLGGGPTSINCCVQVDPCGVCFGDAVTPTSCMAGVWTCTGSFRLESQCTRWAWQGDAAGAPPACDAGM